MTIRRSDILLLIGAGACFLLLRAPLYCEPGLHLGWNSDSAIFGLMAREMARAGSVTWFYWGQDYLGTITSMVTVAAGWVTGAIGPLTLRIAAACELLAGFLFFWSAIRCLWGRAAAHLTVFWLLAGPAYFFKLSYAPNAEQMFLLGAVLFWYVVRFRFLSCAHWFFFGALTGMAWWAHRGAVMVVPWAVAVVAWYDDQWRRPLRAALAAAAMAAGVSAGLLPILFGRLQQSQPLYAPTAVRWSLSFLRDRIVETVTGDLWQFLGADAGRPFSTFAAVLVLLLTLFGLSRMQRSRNELFALGVAVTCAAFWVMSTTAYAGALRYLVILLPIVFGLAARGVVALWNHPHRASRVLAVALALTVAASFALGRAGEVQRIAAGNGEQHEQWPGGFDPRPAMHALSAGDYQTCYADFWLAYKLEWLSGVPFIPYRSVDRTQLRSLQLAAAPGRKCFVERSGEVVTLNEHQAEQLRAETVAHWQRRNGRRESN